MAMDADWLSGDRKRILSFQTAEMAYDELVAYTACRRSAEGQQRPRAYYRQKEVPARLTLVEKLRARYHSSGCVTTVLMTDTERLLEQPVVRIDGSALDPSVARMLRPPPGLGT